MFTAKLTYTTSGRPVTYAEYADVNDFREALCSKRAVDAPVDQDKAWAGGSRAQTVQKLKTGDEKYAKRAEKFADMANVALSDYDIDWAYNHQFGVRDEVAYEAGVPDFLYGPTITQTEKAPVAIFLDQWILWSIPPVIIERRGIAALALIQALSLFRPVRLFMCLANRHEPSDTDCIQVVPAPTTPMDLGRAGFMVGATQFVRAGMMRTLFCHTKGPHAMTPCSIPMLSGGMAWQRDELGYWLAERVGVNPDSFVHLPMMFDQQQFGSNADAQKWVNENVARFANH